jgi:hypothetical protein
MRMVVTALAAALAAGGLVAAQAAVPPTPIPDAPVLSGNQPLRLSQGLPSDVEQRMGIRPNSANRDRRGGVPSDWEQHGRRGGVPSDWEQHGYRAGPRFSDRRHYCEQRALRRGLDGREFQRFVRYCVDR